MCHCSAGVSGGCSEDGDALFASDSAEDLGHEVSTKVFEGECRPMEQLQDIEVLSELHDRRGEGEGVCADPLHIQ